MPRAVADEAGTTGRAASREAAAAGSVGAERGPVRAETTAVQPPIATTRASAPMAAAIL